MDFNIGECDDNIFLLSNTPQNNAETFSCDLQGNIFARDCNIPSDTIITSENESSDNFETSENNQSSDTDDLLRNGILVETNKGLVCMSLKDVLSSDLNLSIEDVKNVAAQLLAQQELSVPVTTGTEGKISDVDIKKESQTSFDSLDRKQISFDAFKQENLNFTENVTEVTDNTTTEELSDTVIFNAELQSTSAVTSEAVDTSEETDKDKNPFPIHIVPKRRGGWPKGRKRKPELLNLPPKAPKTSYNIFLNERRKLYKDKLAFHEITRVVGNQWSNLSNEEKKPYIERAEEDKKRYRQELRVYRQSDAYKLYLARKRKKRALDNMMSESDMDGTDDIDDEDNEMLYCDMCDQWFHSMHNKREHLLSRQHKNAVAGDIKRNLESRDNEIKVHVIPTCPSMSLDESSMDAAPMEVDSLLQPIPSTSTTESVYDAMVQLLEVTTKREKEIQILRNQLEESKLIQNQCVEELENLKGKSERLVKNLSKLKGEGTELKRQLYGLWNVPSLFVMTNFNIVNIAEL